jgi:hypothetical protein
MAPPVLPHAVARRLDPGLGPLERVGVGGPLLLLLLLLSYSLPDRVDVHSSPSLQFLHFHLARMLVAMRLAQQAAALLAPEAPDSRPHDERRHLGEALEGDAAAPARITRRWRLGMRDAGAHSPHFFLQNFLNLSLVMSAKTSASVAYLWTFDGWLDDDSAALLAETVFGLAACSELGLETCSLICSDDL